MKVIYKYPLEVIDHQWVHMPHNAVILSCQMQGGNLCLWAEVDKSIPATPRRITIYPTGQEMQKVNLRYIGTVQHSIFVWHVYENFYHS